MSATPTLMTLRIFQRGSSLLSRRFASSATRVTSERKNYRTAGKNKVHRPNLIKEDVSFINSRQSPAVRNLSLDLTDEEVFSEEHQGYEPTDKKIKAASFVKHFVASRNHCTDEEWESLRTEAVNNRFASEDSFGGLILHQCIHLGNFPLGKSLVEWLEKSSELSVALLALYMHLCGLCVSEAGVDLVLHLHERLKAKAPLVDAVTADHIVKGLTSTSRWKDALPYIDMMRLISTPSASAYSSIAEAAFRNADQDTGWRLLNSMVKDERQPSGEVLLSYLSSNCNFTDMISLLNFLRVEQISISQDVMEHIKGLFESQREHDWQGCVTTVTSKGQCRNCGSPLERMDMTTEEYNLLREHFIDHVIARSDVFLKTTPAELDKYRNFLVKTAPYDIVLDGLNIAYSGTNRIRSVNDFAEQLLRAVEYFKYRHNKRVLVVGRQHMLTKWPKSIVTAIRNLAPCFYTENISKDDPFLLFAAIYSGMGTMFVSKDLMRDHSYCLRNDRALVNSFRRWQKMHQLLLLTVSPEGNVIYKPPVVHNTVVQSTEESWHIPFREELGKLDPEGPQKWLCLKKISSSQLQLTGTKLGTLPKVKGKNVKTSHS